MSVFSEDFEDRSGAHHSPDPTSFGNISAILLRWEILNLECWSLLRSCGALGVLNSKMASFVLWGQAVTLQNPISSPKGKLLLATPVTVEHFAWLIACTCIITESLRLHSTDCIRVLAWSIILTTPGLDASTGFLGVSHQIH